MISLQKGTKKLFSKVAGLMAMPGNISETPLASAAKLTKHPTEIMP
jgi:hypothetical protein